MKESWLLYDYLRCWWRLLLLGSIWGAVLGLGYYSIQDHPVEYVVTADLVFEDPEYSGRGSPPTFTLAMAPTGQPTGDAAIREFRSLLATFANSTNSPVVLQDLSIDVNPTVEPWWKAVVLGSVIGTLLVIGGVHVLEDAQVDQRRQQTEGTYT